MTKIDFDLVVSILAARGVAARVTHTGGGCATIVVGTGEAEAYCGPGWFEGPAFTQAVGVYDDLYIGGRKEDGAVVQADTEAGLVEELVAAVAAFQPIES